MIVRIFGSILIGLSGVGLVYMAIRLARSRDDHLAWAQGQTFVSQGWLEKRAEQEAERKKKAREGMDEEID